MVILIRYGARDQMYTRRFNRIEKAAGLPSIRNRNKSNLPSEKRSYNYANRIDY